MKHGIENETMVQIDILSIVRDVVRQWWVILILSISVSLFANVWVTWTYRPEYTATATFVVTAKGMNNNIYQNLTTAKEIAGRFSQILESNVMKRKVAEDIGIEAFNGTTSASVLTETNLIELRVTADSAMEAYQAMHSIMNNYNTVSDYVIENVILEVLQPPAVPMAPSNSINVKRTMKMAFLISAGIFILCFAVLSYLKDTVKNEKEASEKIDAKLLGTIYHERKVKMFRGIRKAKRLSMLIQNPLLSFRFVESNKMTASKIRSRMIKKGIQTLMVTSVTENEGKSTVAANLALALAQENKKVLLLDCDFRKPAQYKIFDMPKKDTINLPKMLKTKQLAENPIRRWKKSGLYIIANGEASSSMEGLPENELMELILNFAKEKMDYIIIDTPPVTMAADAEEIAQMADASILVVKQDKVLARDINDAIDMLNRTKGKVLGCVFNDVMTGILGKTGGYGYGGYYGYGGHYGKRTES